MARSNLDTNATTQIFSASLVKELEDEQYHCLEQFFVARGRGRRPDLPHGALANFRVYLQLHLLRTRHDKTRHFVEGILARLFPFTSDYEFRSVMERCLRDTPAENEDWKGFLSQTSVKLGPFSEYRERIGNGLENVTRRDLLGNLDLLKEKLANNNVSVTITNELVVKLERFRGHENLPSKFTQSCLETFDSNFQFQCSEKKAKKLIDSVEHKYTQLQKSKSKELGKKKFEDFCRQLFIIPEPQVLVQLPLNPVSTSVGDTDSPTPSTSSSKPAETKIQQEEVRDGGHRMIDTRAIQLGIELRMVNGKLEELGKENSELRLKLGVLMDENGKKNVELIARQQQINTIEADLLQTKSKSVTSAKDLAALKAGCVRLKSELGSAQHSAIYKRMKRKDDLFETYEQFYMKHSGEEGCSKEINDLKNTIKNLQTQIWKLKTVIEGLRVAKEENKKKIADLKAECDRHVIHIEDIEPQGLKTKVGGQYTNDVVRCVIQLIGEVGVPACRCAKTIQCICQCLFNVTLEEKDLPSSRSNMRYADRGNVLSEMHLADTILQSDGYDLHTDGTSRSNTTYVGNQATMSTGRVMSFGYSMVVTENTDTLLELATGLLTELSDVYTPDDGDPNVIYKEMLKKMVGLMSDRASVMKSFNTAMNQTRNETLGLDDDSIQLQYLFCSAHFLLGLSSEAEKAIKELQQPLGKLGRDALPAFKRFSGAGESVVARVIRTGCDVLGPRGDEKNGCRQAWEAYCSLKGQKSHIKSFRGNRFNNYFEGASSLHFHRMSIIDYFSNYRATPNLKLQSVLADCQSDVIDSMLSAVGMIYFVLTGPYWKLITSDTEYLDLYKYIVPMREKFVQFSTDASSLVSADLVSIIPHFSVDGGDEYAKLMEVTDKTLLQTSLEKLFKGFLAVTDRQLSDFLPGGRYHDVQDPDLRKRMKHSQLTNLTGEANLADLDYSIFTRRNATLHHRSLLNMMKRNKPMTTWLNLKPEDEQNDLLSRSAKKAQSLRDKHRQDEIAVQKKAQDRILGVKQTLTEKRAKVLKRKADLSENVKIHGGPCLHPKDVDVLLEKVKTVTAKKKALNSEIQYLKVVLGAKSKLLVASKLPWETVAQNLKTFLNSLEEENNGLSVDGVAQLNTDHTNTITTTTTSVTLTSDDEDSIDSDDEAALYNDQSDASDPSSGSSGDELPDTASETESEENVIDEMDTDVNSTPANKRKSNLAKDSTPAKMRKPDTFKFTSQGEWVAVYYSDSKGGHTYHIGQVLDFVNEKEGHVTYLEQCSLKKSLYRFGSLDVHPVGSQYVFHHGFNVTTTNGRIWSLENEKELKHLFKQYVRIYC